MTKQHLTLVLLTLLTTGCTHGTGQFDPSRDSLRRDQPQPIYSSDGSDSWNRLFYLLFTRTLDVRLTAGEATSLLAGDERLTLAGGTARRIESGDRAIDPLYPSWLWMGSVLFDMSGSGSLEILGEPRYSHLVEALRDVRRTAPERTPVARALMQADLWAAFDMFFALQAHPHRISSPELANRQRRARELLPLLGATIRALALDRAAIAALPNTYTGGGRKAGLPDLFGGHSEWREVRLSSERMHDHATNFRRAARVFVKPEPPFRVERNVASLEAVALVIQLLLVADDGMPLPSPITFEVQIRNFPGSARNEPLQYELSRRRLLSSRGNDGSEGNEGNAGMVRFGGEAPAYLPIAGNDLSFATRPRQKESPVLVPLRRRCQSCHEAHLGQVFTFQPNLDIEILDPSQNEHGHFVAQRKMDREDFRALRDYWRK